MSFSVDDLVSSFNSSHIGQEAIDLATLQAQLAQTLFYQSPASSGMQSIPRRDSYAQPCNTPTRTPSMSLHWDENSRHRSSSIASARLRAAEEDSQEMEDELMVEDILGAPTSAAPQRPLSQPMAQASSRGHRQTSSAHPFTTPSTPHNLDSPSQSLFVSTDPFYIAATQASYHAASSSFFAQTGRPAANSPFMVPSAQPQPMYSHSMEAETRQVLMAGGQGMFNR